MYSQSEIQQKNRLAILKQLYIGKYKQFAKTSAAVNPFKYQVLQAELLVIKASIPESELPAFYEL